MLLWLFKLFNVRKTLWHKLQTALFSGCKCCCSLCLFNVSFVLKSFPHTSHRWHAVNGRGNDNRFDKIPPVSPLPWLPIPLSDSKPHKYQFVNERIQLFFGSNFHTIFESRFGDESVKQHREIKENNNNFRDIVTTLYVHYKHKKYMYYLFYQFLLSGFFRQRSFCLCKLSFCDEDLFFLLRRYKQNINALSQFDFSVVILNPRSFFFECLPIRKMFP